MHILFITHYFAPDSGAAANQLTHLARGLQQRGHQVTVLTTLPHYPKGIVPPDYRGRFTVVEELDGMRVIQVWLWTTQSASVLWRLLSQISFMLTCALRGLFVARPDVIFIENQPIFTGLAGWFISKIKRRPYLLDVSDYWPEYLYVAGVVSETSLIYRIFKWLTNLTQRDAAGIVTLYDGLLDKIEERIGAVENHRVIHIGVDLDKFHPDVDASAFRREYGLVGVRVVSFLGILGPHIDLDTMLDVARQFRGREDVRFVFAGSGAQKAYLDEQLSQREFDHCITIDWLDSIRIPEFWAASDIHFWALHDNPLDQMRFQAKLYEALGSGTPTVIAVRGLMRDVLARGEMGITVDPGDADALAREIERLLDDDVHYQRISHNARAYAEKHYDARQVVTDYEAMLLALNERNRD